jgi:hypothetical protein
MMKGNLGVSRENTPLRHLSDLKDTEKRLEALVCKLINKPVPFRGRLAELDKMRQEIKSLRSFLNVDDETDLSEHFKALLKKMQEDLEKKRQSLAESVRQEKILERKLANLQAVSVEYSTSPPAVINKRRSLLTARTSLRNFRFDLDQIRISIGLSIANVKDEMRRKLQAECRSRCAELMERNQELLALEREERALNEELELLQKNAENSANQIPHFRNGEDGKSIATKRKAAQQEILHTLINAKSKFTKNIDTVGSNLIEEVDRKAQNLENLCSRTVDKLRELEEKRARTEMANAAIHSEIMLNSLDDLRGFLRRARIDAKLREVMQKMSGPLADQTEKVRKQIKLEEDDKMEAYEGHTLSGLRKELVRLDKEIFRLNFESEAQLREDNEKVRSLERSATEI